MKYFLILLFLSFSILADTPTGGTGAAPNDYGAGGQSVTDPETGITTHSDGSATYPDGNTYDRDGNQISSTDPTSNLNQTEIPEGSPAEGYHYKIVFQNHTYEYYGRTYNNIGGVLTVNYQGDLTNSSGQSSASNRHEFTHQVLSEIRVGGYYLEGVNDYRRNGTISTQIDQAFSGQITVESGTTPLQVEIWIRTYDADHNNPFDGDPSDHMDSEDDLTEEDLNDDDEDGDDDDKDGDGEEEDFENNIPALEDLLDRFDIPTITASEQDPTQISFTLGNSVYSYEGVGSDPSYAGGVSVMKSIFEFVVTILFALAILRQFKT